MSDGSKIEWTDASWNPIRARNLKTGRVGWHCEHATTGCEFCYSEGFNLRLGTGLPYKPGHRKDIDIFLDEKTLKQPLHWKRSRMVFVCSMTDLFADFVNEPLIDRMFAVMATCPQHTFQILTKRADRMCSYLSQFDRRGRYVCSNTRDQLWPDRRDGNRLLLLDEDQQWPLPNVWLGVSTERQEEADERVPALLSLTGWLKFVSIEPLLGAIDLTKIRHRGFFENQFHGDRRPYIDALNGDMFGDGDFDRGRGPLLINSSQPCLSWVIVGGESGPRHRPMEEKWAADIIQQCRETGVAVFMKQMAGKKPIPAHLQIREFPR